MRFSAIVLSVLSLLAFSGAVQARQAPLVDPDPLGWISNIAKDMGTNMQLSAIE